MCQTLWRYVERLVGIIIRPIDLKNQPNYLSFFMKFIRQFIKSFLRRVRKERRLDKGIVENDDYLPDVEDTANWFGDVDIKSNTVSATNLDDYCIEQFKEIMKSLFPVIVMTEDSSNCEVARICLELATFDSSFL